MSSEENIGTYKEKMPDIFTSVSSAIGIHVMLIVLERSLWKTKIKYPEAEKIRFSEEGIFLDGLDGLDREKAEKITSDFVISIIDTLSRLVGIQVAHRLTEELLDEIRAEGDK